MDRFIVYVDDTACAQKVLVAQLARNGAAAQWVLVACAPRMTHRVSKWVSHSARENWRTKWSDKLFSQILSAVPLERAFVTTVVAKGPLAELTAQFMAEDPQCRTQVLDARRPKAEMGFTAAATPSTGACRPGLRGTLGSLLAGLGTVCMLALE